MANTITYVDVANEKAAFDADDIVVIQDKISPSAASDDKFRAMKKTTLSPLRLFMQSGLTVEMSVEGNTLTFKLKRADGSLLSTKAVTLTGGISDVKVDGTSVVINGVAAINGKYTKPTGGIPLTDLTSAVQVSLGKADTAIQEHQDISGKADTSVLTAHTANNNIHVSESDRNSWNSKQDELVSGSSIKTINGTSLLGSGNIEIAGGSSVVLKGKKSGEELSRLTASDVQHGWAYICTSAYESFQLGVMYAAVLSGASLNWVKVGVIDLSSYVPNSRTINGHSLESDITLQTTDIPDFIALTALEAENILNS